MLSAEENVKIHGGEHQVLFVFASWLVQEMNAKTTPTSSNIKLSFIDTHNFKNFGFMIVKSVDY